MLGYTLGFNFLPTLIDYLAFYYSDTQQEALKLALLIVAIVPALAVTVPSPPFIHSLILFSLGCLREI